MLDMNGVNYVIEAFLITSSTYRYAVQTISSPYGVGRSWAGYCWHSPPSRCTFHGTFGLRGLAQDCPRLYVRSFPEFTRFALTAYAARGQNLPRLAT